VPPFSLFVEVKTRHSRVADLQINIFTTYASQCCKNDICKSGLNLISNSGAADFNFCKIAQGKLSAYNVLAIIADARSGSSKDRK